MFEAIKDYLNSLSPLEKKELIENIKTFQSLKSLLMAKGVVIQGKNPGEFLVVGNHTFADAFIKVFKKMSRKERVITFTAHPMLLYDHALGKTDEDKLEQIFKFVDYLKGQENIEFIDQWQLLQLFRAGVR